MKRITDWFMKKNTQPREQFEIEGVTNVLDVHGSMMNEVVGEGGRDQESVFATKFKRQLEQLHRNKQAEMANHLIRNQIRNVDEAKRLAFQAAQYDADMMETTFKTEVPYDMRSNTMVSMSFKAQKAQNNNTNPGELYRTHRDIMLKMRRAQGDDDL